ALAVRLTIPATGLVEDLHIQASVPCRAHKEKRLKPENSSLCETAYHLEYELQTYKKIYCLTKTKTYLEEKDYKFINDYTRFRNFCKCFLENS
ncbi:MAG: hypothetical protein JXA81_09740, partial [Sedimentisphaerales bacterium]|nr:hypothetical protein [Sedimentisphaerales bacterium]